MELNDLMAVERRSGLSDSLEMASERCFGRPDVAIVSWPWDDAPHGLMTPSWLGRSDGAKLALEWCVITKKGPGPV